MDYETLRTFADTWGLLFLVALFAGIVVFVFRRGARRHYRDASTVIFRHEHEPAKDGGADGRRSPDGGKGD